MPIFRIITFICFLALTGCFEDNPSSGIPSEDMWVDYSVESEDGSRAKVSAMIGDDHSSTGDFVLSDGDYIELHHGDLIKSLSTHDSTFYNIYSTRIDLNSSELLFIAYHRKDEVSALYSYVDIPQKVQLHSTPLTSFSGQEEVMLFWEEGLQAENNNEIHIKLECNFKNGEVDTDYRFYNVETLDTEFHFSINDLLIFIELDEIDTCNVEAEFLVTRYGSIDSVLGGGNINMIQRSLISLNYDKG